MKNLILLIIVATLPLTISAQEGLFTQYGANFYDVQFTDSLNGWLVADGFIMTSNDGGDNWKVKLSINSGSVETEGANAWYNPDTYNFTEFHFFDKYNAWIMAYYNKDKKFYILKTIDGGNTWKQYDCPPLYNNPISFTANYSRTSFINKNTGYIARQHKIYKTLDGGVTWNEISTISGSNISVYEMIFTDENTGWCTLAAGPENANIARTTDGGKTWTKIKTIANYITSISVVKDTIYAGSSNAGLIRSIDAGQSWSKIATGDFRYIKFFNSNNGFKSGTGGTFKTVDGGFNWTIVNTNASLRSIFSPEKFWLKYGDNSLVKYTENGANSKYQILGFEIRDIEIVNNNTIVAVGKYGKILRSTDGGITWKTNWDFHKAYPNCDITEVEFFNSNTGLISSKTGVGNDAKALIWKTIDAGASWVLQSDTLGLAISEMVIKNDVCFVFVGTTLFVSIDYGNNWTKGKSTPGNTGLIESFFTSGTTGYVSDYLPGRISRTTDGGKNWTVLSNAPIGSGFYFVGTTGYMNSANKLYKTSDEGLSWTVIYDKAVSPASTTPARGDYYFINEQIGFATADGFYKTLDGGLNWTLISTFDGYEPKFLNQTTGWVISGSLTGNNKIIYGTSPIGKLIPGNTGPTEPKVILEQNFDGETFPPTGWLTSVSNGKATWQKGNVKDENFSIIDPTNIFSAYCPWIDENQNEMLASPSFSLSGESATLEFYAGYSTEFLNAASMYLYIGSDTTNINEIWRCENDGKDWQFRKVQIDLSAYQNKSGLKLVWQYYGRNGDIVAIDNIKLTDNIISNLNKPTTLNNNLNLKNYPNPFKNETTLNYTLDRISDIQINIYDMMGKKVKEIKEKNINPGNHSIEIHFDSAIKKGLYILKFETETQKESLKISRMSSLP